MRLSYQKKADIIISRIDLLISDYEDMLQQAKLKQQVIRRGHCKLCALTCTFCPRVWIEKRVCPPNIYEISPRRYYPIKEWYRLEAHELTLERIEVLKQWKAKTTEIWIKCLYKVHQFTFRHNTPDDVNKWRYILKRIQNET